MCFRYSFFEGIPRSVMIWTGRKTGNFNGMDGVAAAGPVVDTYFISDAVVLALATVPLHRLAHANSLRVIDGPMLHRFVADCNRVAA